MAPLNLFKITLASMAIATSSADTPSPFGWYLSRSGANCDEACADTGSTAMESMDCAGSNAFLEINSNARIESFAGGVFFGGQNGGCDFIRDSTGTSVAGMTWPDYDSTKPGAKYEVKGDTAPAVHFFNRWPNHMRHREPST